MASYYANFSSKISEEIKCFSGGVLGFCSFSTFHGKAASANSLSMSES